MVEALTKWRKFQLSGESFNQVGEVLARQGSFGQVKETFPAQTKLSHVAEVLVEWDTLTKW